jgi:hypothetical protein
MQMAAKKTTETKKQTLTKGVEEKVVTASESPKEKEIIEEMAQKDGTTVKKINDKITLKIIRH